MCSGNGAPHDIVMSGSITHLKISGRRASYVFAPPKLALLQMTAVSSEGGILQDSMLASITVSRPISWPLPLALATHSNEDEADPEPSDSPPACPSSTQTHHI